MTPAPKVVIPGVISWLTAALSPSRPASRVLARNSTDDIADPAPLAANGSNRRSPLIAEFFGHHLCAVRQSHRVETEPAPVDRDRLTGLDRHAASNRPLALDSSPVEGDPDRSLDIGAR